MKKTILLVVFILAVSSLALAQRGTPTFSQYAVKTQNIKSKPVNLASHKDARMFRTNLRNAAKGNVNFAGQFIITTWGCGTSCAQVALIDARTGNVFFPPQLQGIGIGQGEWAYDLDVLEYKPNSRLLKLNGYDADSRDGDNPDEGIHYFQWTGKAFKKIKFVKKSSN